MGASVEIGGRRVGHGEPCLVVAEIGINHNGSRELALRLIDAAVAAGVDAVKFQKRTPELCVPRSEWDRPRETPWGLTTYIDYRHKVEFDRDDYLAIAERCNEHGVMWFASCWDEPSVDFIEEFEPPCYKIASATLTDDAVLTRLRATGRPLLLSTGMSTLEEIDHAVGVIGKDDLIVLHATSTYPAAVDELNLAVIPRLVERYQVPVGYSGHEVGLAPSLAAVALGACVLERHLTLDRSMWGTDQAASVEPQGFARLVRDVRVVEAAMSDGVKRVYDSELAVRSKLRRVS